MNHYFYIKTQNGLPIERSLAIESEELPTVTIGWDEVWTQTEWNDYVASIPVLVLPTPETATSISDFYGMPCDSYINYQLCLLEFVKSLGGGDEEVGFDTLSAEEKSFVALNAIGTAEQIASVLANPNREMLEHFITKQIIQQWQI